MIADITEIASEPKLDAGSYHGRPVQAVMAATLVCALSRICGVTVLPLIARLRIRPARPVRLSACCQLKNALRRKLFGLIHPGDELVGTHEHGATAPNIARRSIRIMYDFQRYGQI